MWPTSHSDLIKKHFRAFIQFTNAIVIDKLTNEPKGESYFINVKCDEIVEYVE